jgi:hypothetical protein
MPPKTTFRTLFIENTALPSRALLTREQKVARICRLTINSSSSRCNRCSSNISSSSSSNKPSSSSNRYCCNNNRYNNNKRALIMDRNYRCLKMLSNKIRDTIDISSKVVLIIKAAWVSLESGIFMSILSLLIE